MKFHRSLLDFRRAAAAHAAMEEEQPQSAIAKMTATQDLADGRMSISLKAPASNAGRHGRRTARIGKCLDDPRHGRRAADCEVARFCTFEPLQSRDDVARYIRNVVLPHPWFRLICLQCRAIGAVSVTQNWGNELCRGEMGYVLASRYWGKGIATKAVKLAAASVFWERAGLERLEKLVDVDNVWSQRVLVKAGFTQEGVLRKYCRLKGRTRAWSCLASYPLIHCSSK